MSDLILTFDCGTQSIRAMLFDKKGNLVAKSKLSFEPYFSTQKGFAEQNPDFYFEKLCHASIMLKSANEDIWDNIIAVTITTMRDTMIHLDADNKVIRPAILWLDTRHADARGKIPFGARMAFSLVGMGEAARMNYEHSKSNWIRQNEIETWEKTARVVMLSGFMAYKLTDRLVDSVASQIGHIPFDYKNKRWNKPSNIKNCIFNIPTNVLPNLVNPTERIGEITAAASQLTGILQGTPVIATGSDKGCETLGTGCLTEDKAALSFGTTSTVQVTTKRYVEPQKFLPAYPAVVPDCYNPEIEIFRGYWMVTWFKNEFMSNDILKITAPDLTPDEFLNSMLELTPAGCDGLVLQPYWGPGLKNPEARGAIVGFSDVHKREHIYRAIIEGINFGLMDGLEKLKKSGKFKTKCLTVSGGGSQSNVICQITADMFGLPVKRVQTYETSGLGSSIAGFVGMGAFTDFESAVNSMVRYESVFTPNAANTRIYEQLRNTVYSKIYPSLKHIYVDMKNKDM